MGVVLDACFEVRQSVLENLEDTRGRHKGETRGGDTRETKRVKHERDMRETRGDKKERHMRELRETGGRHARDTRGRDT